MLLLQEMEPWHPVLADFPDGDSHSVWNLTRREYTALEAVLTEKRQDKKRSRLAEEEEEEQEEKPAKKKNKKQAKKGEEGPVSRQGSQR